VAREIHIDSVDDIPRPIIAISHDYPDGHLVKPHHHRRGQLISGASGVIVLSTTEGTWVMPPHRGMWIPPMTQHHVQMVGATSVQSLYIEPGAIAGLPGHCQVVEISPFTRGLITEALSLPLEYELEGREGALMQLIQYEMQRLPALSLSLRYPANGPLSALCRRFVQEPSIHATIDLWADALSMSRRSFTRLFRRETGMSFVAWRQQACLLCAMPRLAAGEAVTTIAIDLGYENPAAFTLMFRRAFGSPPLAYLGLRRG
jgi:AraC-like DNA-binding protein